MILSAFAGLPRAIRSRFFGKRIERPSAVVESLERRALLTGFIEHLAFFTQPANAMAGATVLPPVVIDLKNQDNSIAVTDTSQVTLTLSSGVFGGTTTVAAINGVAVFNNVTIPSPGVYKFTASAVEERPIISNAFTVTPALHLAFVQQPIDAVAGGPIAPVTVGVEDPDNNIVLARTPSIVTVASSDGSLVASAVVVNGKAIFSNLSLNAAGAYTLKATAGRDGAAISDSFAVTPASTAPLTLATTVLASTLPAAVVMGSPVHGSVAIVIGNETQLPMHGPITVNLFASTDGAIDGAAVLLATAVRQINLKPGKTAVLRLRVNSSSAALGDGAYALLAQSIDTSGSASNAPFGPWLRIEAPAVQLQDAVGSLPFAKIRPGGGAAVPVIVTNEGNAAFNGVATFDVGLSTDGLTESASLDTAQRHLRLQPGRSVILFLRLNTTPALAPGAYFPFVSITESGVTVPAVGPTPFAIV
ncbi:MAG TPA: hypothetical protein VFC46_01425 [Humisphaera sp.]|nr:hypothetical protein [Humisphaera sp.]